MLIQKFSDAECDIAYKQMPLVLPRNHRRLSAAWSKSSQEARMNPVSIRSGGRCSSFSRGRAS